MIKGNANTQTCGTCKFYAQGKTCSFCEHPKATKEERSYRYYIHGCEDKYEKGVSDSRIKYMQENKAELDQKFKKHKSWLKKLNEFMRNNSKK